MKTIVVLYKPNDKIYKVFTTFRSLHSWCIQNKIPVNGAYKVAVYKGFKRWWILQFHKIIT